MKEKCRHKSMSRHIKKRKRQYNLYITEGQRGKWDPQGYVIRRTFFFFITIIITRPFSRRGGSFDCLWMVFLSVWVDRRFVTGANCLMPSEASTVMDVTLPPLPIYVVEIRWGQNKKKSSVFVYFYEYCTPFILEEELKIERCWQKSVYRNWTDVTGAYW